MTLEYYIIELRQRGRMAGFSLYVLATAELQDSTLCYKNGPHLPPLNFTTTCTEYGRFVTFYNERLDVEMYPTGYEINNVYTELCEVIVQGKYLLRIGRTFYYVMQSKIARYLNKLEESESLTRYYVIKELTKKFYRSV